MTEKPKDVEKYFENSKCKICGVVVQPHFQGNTKLPKEEHLAKKHQVWTLTDKEKIKKTLELIQDFEDSGSSKHYKANAQKMRIMLDAIKKTLEK